MSDAETPAGADQPPATSSKPAVTKSGSDAEPKRPLKIAILSRKASLYSTSRLREAALARGHEAIVVDYLRCYMNITSHRPALIYQGKELTGFDAVIPRIGASHTFYGTAVVRQFEMMGVFPANESQAIARSRDKLRCLQLLAREGIGLPVSGFAHSTKDVQGLIEAVGGAPLVVKLLEGTQGIGVVLCETNQASESVIEAFRGLDANILVQEFIKEAGGADIRAFVVGNKVVAAMLRQGAPGEFRSNLHRGGSASRIKLTPEERSTAVRSAKSMGLRVAGVDMLRSNHGPVVMEVNSSPGLEGIEGSTGKDVAGLIIQYIENNAAAGRTRDRIKG
ncbi:MAG: putative alpha-L-glutamate ligase [Planctomycetota bacterium]|nr:MAG: putative alpha-L-glutamate ligase [Planctomycetota bacterium]